MDIHGIDHVVRYHVAINIHEMLSRQHALLRLSVQANDVSGQALCEHV